MELEKYKYEARLLVFKMAKLMVEAAADEDIKKRTADSTQNGFYSTSTANRS